MGGGQDGAVDVAIVGGGIVGVTLAHHLARAGASVVVVERDGVGREASGNSAGLITPPSAPDSPPARVRLLARSIHAYPAFIAEIEEVTGDDTGWRQRGEISVALTEEEADLLRRFPDWHRDLGFTSQWLDAAALRELEPALPDGVLGGVLTREAGSLFSYRLTRVAAAAAARRGARVLEYTPALGVEAEGDRATGVRIPGGVIRAGQVVLAAGAWTARFGLELGRPLPTIPVKGQMLAIAEAPVQPRHIIHSPSGGYIVPRTDGTVAVGATVDHAGFDRRPTAARVRDCLAIAERLSPALLRGQIASIWAGLRPSTTDGEPMMGLVPGYRNLWVATGHFRVGIQMAVVTAELMTESIQRGAPAAELAPFSPGRFSEGLG